MATFFKQAAVIVCFLLLSGCWDVKTIQDINYVTAVGIDYEEGKYSVYAQLLDFTNVAKQQGGGKPSQEAPVFVGRGKGNTLGEAFDDLIRSAQQQMFWGHVSALVIGERLLKKGLMKKDFDSMVRFREIRFSQWMYGTKLPIPDIFSAKSFFNLSSLSTILHQPEMSYRQSSTLRPMRLQTVIAQMQEPGNTVLLPSLGITNSTWKEDLKPAPQLYEDGIFALYEETPSVFFGLENVIGTRWTQDKTGSLALTLLSGSNPAASLVCKKLRHTIHTGLEGGVPVFSITGKVRCRINELIKENKLDTLKQLAQNEISKEIKTAYQTGKEMSRDVLRLEHVLYKHDSRSWGKLTDYGKKPLKSYSLKSVFFEVDLLHSGMYKDETEDTDY